MIVEVYSDRPTTFKDGLIFEKLAAEVLAPLQDHGGAQSAGEYIEFSALTEVREFLLNFFVVKVKPDYIEEFSYREVSEYVYVICIDACILCLRQDVLEEGLRLLGACGCLLKGRFHLSEGYAEAQRRL